MSTTPTLTVLPRVPIDAEIMDRYEESAAKHNRSLEAEIADRLTKFASADSEKPIVLSDTERRAIEHALNQNFTHAYDLASAVVKLTTVRVDGINIHLGKTLQERLQSRALGLDLEPFVESTIRRLLEEFVGLR